MSNLITEPRPSKFTNPQTGQLTPAAANYFDLVLMPRVDASANVTYKTSTSEPQSAAIGLTTLVASASGRYRISIYGQVVQAASVSSSLNASVVSTYNGQSITQSLTAATGNALDTVLMGTLIVQADAGSLLSYSTAYASVGGTVMQYDLYVTVEVL